MSAHDGRRTLKPVNQVLNQVVTKLGLSKRLREHTLLSLWPNLVGERFSQRSRCLFIDLEGNMVVTVSDAPTGADLSLMKPQILKKIRPLAESIGVKVKGLRIDLKQYHNLLADPEPPSSFRLVEPTAEDLKKIVLSDAERAELESIAASVQEGGAIQNLAKRILHLCEMELRLRHFRRQNGYPVCQGCDLPVVSVHHQSGLCTACHSKG